MAELLGAIASSLALLEILARLVQETSTLISDIRLFGSDAEKLRLRFSVEERRLFALKGMLFTPLDSTSPHTTTTSSTSTTTVVVKREEEHAHATSKSPRCLAEHLPTEVMADIFDMLVQLERVLIQGRVLRLSFGIPTSTTSTTSPAPANPPLSLLKKAKWALTSKPKAESILTEFSAWNTRARMLLEDVLWPLPQFKSLAGLQTLQGNGDARTLGLGGRAGLRRLVLAPRERGEGGGGSLRIQGGRFIPAGSAVKKDGHEGGGGGGGHRPPRFAIGTIKVDVQVDDQTGSTSHINDRPSSHTHGHPVITELKSIEVDPTAQLSTFDNNPAAGGVDTPTTRIHHLAALLNRHNDPGFRVLHCRGYIEQKPIPTYLVAGNRPPTHDISLVFDIPEKYLINSGFISTCTLLDAIPFVKNVSSGGSTHTPGSSSGSNPSTSNPSSFRPVLGSRFSLAHKLAETLYLLHTVGWVHKSLRSENVVFFLPSTTSTTSSTTTTTTTPQSSSLKPPTSPTPTTLPDITTPYLFGFDYSRRESDFSSRRHDDALKRNIYRHPRRWGLPRERFGKVHDIYALGVLLLEIGLWQRAETLDSPSTSFKSLQSSPEKVQALFLRHVEKRLGYTAGEKFQGVVRKCLSGELAVAERAEKEEGAEEEEEDDEVLVGAAAAEFRIHKRFRTEVVEVLERLASEV
ncbi:hypothetical protein DFH27DRAFT_625475 [Peziza echinospora]|nr:hypothetical protein DFH27DRAFT_625475 [Peziza echinospora]